MISNKSFILWLTNFFLAPKDKTFDRESFKLLIEQSFQNNGANHRECHGSLLRNPFFSESGMKCSKKFRVILHAWIWKNPFRTLILDSTIPRVNVVMFDLSAMHSE